jgi:hypothetical protein
LPQQIAGAISLKKEKKEKKKKKKRIQKFLTRPCPEPGGTGGRGHIYIFAAAW